MIPREIQSNPEILNGFNGDVGSEIFSFVVSEKIGLPAIRF
jgi:hypothetical protein